MKNRSVLKNILTIGLLILSIEVLAKIDNQVYIENTGNDPIRVTVNTTDNNAVTKTVDRYDREWFHLGNACMRDISLLSNNRYIASKVRFQTWRPPGKACVGNLQIMTTIDGPKVLSFVPTGDQNVQPIITYLHTIEDFEFEIQLLQAEKKNLGNQIQQIQNLSMAESQGIRKPSLNLLTIYDEHIQYLKRLIEHIDGLIAALYRSGAAL